ncbi:hypothetical protein GGQ84_003015 [Desulfitispora alkaliphila]|uniref:hypothetical protein n=1 Tax=Desulfitispora alkaliphila TaxID=622674 RepID=UPI003D2048AA
MKNNFRIKMKKTISMKQFISELGSNFSKHTQERLLEVGARCVLTRSDKKNVLDLKHIEHTKFDSEKEYAYGQFVVEEGELFFSNKCCAESGVMEAPIVSQIFESMDGEVVIFDEDIKVKKIDAKNIDYVIDSILNVCPVVSPEHLAILAKYK